MFRVIDLPCEVDLSKAKASFNDGRLKVVIPRAAPAKSVSRGDEGRVVPEKVGLLFTKQADRSRRAARRLLLEPTSYRQGARRHRRGNNIGRRKPVGALKGLSVQLRGNPKWKIRVNGNSKNRREVIEMKKTASFPGHIFRLTIYTGKRTARG